MRPSRTSVLALTGLLAAAWPGPRNRPRPTRRRRRRRPRGEGRDATRRATIVETPGLSRGGRGHRPEAHGGHRGDSGLGHGRGRPARWSSSGPTTSRTSCRWCPGLSLTTTRPGVTRITLRGINTGGVASTIGVYFDDVPFGSSTGLANGAIVSGDFDTFDIARVEVLRGPQGTLYGASSLGGVIKYVPNRPSTERFEARVLGSAETVDNGDPGYSLTGLVNVPLGDKAAFRASGFYRFDSGFIDSIGNNPVPSLTQPGDQRHRRHARRRRPQLPRPVRRALRRCCSSPPTSSR